MQPSLPPGDPTNVVGKRFLAGLIDLAPLYVLMFVLSWSLQTAFVFGPTFDGSGSSDASAGVTLLGIFAVTYGVPLALAVANSIVYRSRTGASLGQRAVGLVTVTEEGQRLSAGACTGRFFLGVVDGFPWCCYLPVVGMITIGVAKGHRRVADMVVRSYVVPEAFAGVPLGPPANLLAGRGPWGQPIQPQPYGGGDQPQWDPARQTWVRFDPMSGRWFGWHQPTQAWHPLDG